MVTRKTKKRVDPMSGVLDFVRSWTGAVLGIAAVIGTGWAAFQVIDTGAEAMTVATDAKVRAEKLEDRYNKHVEREWREYQMQKNMPPDPGPGAGERAPHQGEGARGTTAPPAGRDQGGEGGR